MLSSDRETAASDLWLVDQSPPASNGWRGSDSTTAVQWLVDPDQSGGPKKQTDEEVMQSVASRGANGRGTFGQGEPGVSLGRLEEQADVRRIEISALVRRVAELEAELATAKKDAANAKRQATLARRAIENRS
jgi:hypothetical protein